jgi:hypothetical protein
MRITSRPELTSAVARIRTAREVVVASLARLPSDAVLDLARLVLSAAEYEQLRQAMPAGRDHGRPCVATLEGYRPP